LKPLCQNSSGNFSVLGKPMVHAVGSDRSRGSVSTWPFSVPAMFQAAAAAQVKEMLGW